MKILALVALFVATAFAHTANHYEFVPELRRSVTRVASQKDAAAQPFRAITEEEAVEVAKKLVAKQFPNVDVVIRDAYRTKHNEITHVYFRQLVNGLEVANADMNVNVLPSGMVLSYGESLFLDPMPVLPDTPVLSAEDAIVALGKHIHASMAKEVQHIKTLDQFTELFTGGDLSLDEIKAEIMYIHDDDGLEMAWRVVVRQESNWYDAYVDAVTGELETIIDWYDDADYRVYPLGTNDPSDGQREVVVDPHLDAPEASPLGWHDQGNSRQFTDTRGNNVFAQENLDGSSSWQNNYRPDGGSSLTFDFPIDETEMPVEYVDASVTNLFYFNNILHDLLYAYGFDEVSGNFQENNFGRGGRENDAVQANAQDGAGFNNANFATPSDGNRPRMRMYVWTRTGGQPYVDGDLDNGIIIHEYAHGLSNRLTGGPTNTGCLPSGEPGGMGEGWGDCIATAWRMSPSNTRNDDFEMGDWAAGSGIRYYPYSTSNVTNPQSYESINESRYSGVHAKGCVWCSMLYEVYWNLVDEHGFDSDWYNGKGGNNLWMQLVVDGMKLQPCRPSFVDARDAIIQADDVNNGGMNYCLLWRAFAKRGLGVSARSGTRVTQDFSVPPSC